MTPPSAEVARRWRWPLPPLTAAFFALKMFIVLVIVLLSARALEDREITANRVTRTLAAIETLGGLMSSVKDAETGQRGYLLSGSESYLEPFAAAKRSIPADLERARELFGDGRQRARIAALERDVNDKLAELDATIAMRREGDATGAIAVVVSDRGKAAMDRIRATVGEMIAEERQVLNQRQTEWASAVRLLSQVQVFGAAVLLLLIAVSALVAAREHRARETAMWVRNGLVGLTPRVQGGRRLEALGEGVLSYLAGYLGACVGALYLAERDGSFRRVAAHAAPAAPETLQPGEGLLGQVAKDNRVLVVRDVPAGYVEVASAVGGAAPRELLLAPASIDGVVYAVLELGLFRKTQPADEELIARASELLGVAVRAARDRTRLEELLDETQRQAEALQTQQEELRVNNEELEEQGRALKASQTQLEAQQSELEATNAQLEEQASLLEAQRDDLARSQQATAAKAEELERANRYKSEFLANMSHELRTPLNSTLILAKLLADNKGGNLTGEQVRYAQTISSAGNDLLTLINDVLDLSKIEAGMVELHVEPVSLAATVGTLVKNLQPQAQQKGLQLRAQVDAQAPPGIETDPQRLGQILKNLLANAIKFTERGQVTLRVEAHGEDGVVFAVTDTGIGIAPDQQTLIFEAFRQADGSTHRKYGGTGLGLSISRDLAHLLGGEIDVRSAPGAGSTFRLTLPRQYRGPVIETADAASAPAATPAVTPPPAATVEPAAPPAVTRRVADDRDALRPNARLILVIEDDVRFAEILRDLAREMDFQCIVTHGASEGLTAAASYRPSGILLDINLPDHSGLAVLDQLKRDPRTRHVPVHVLSVADHVQEARLRGAVGYDLKPVQRSQLVEALKRLEAKSSQDVRRVLVVEDDAAQRDSIEQLLRHDGVEITGVESAAAALAQLRGTTFDCVIMDLKLPDLSGFELLEQMAASAESSFPPVIVYTGRSLTPEQERELRRFSKSIIIKDARSPERLLDEVTLFLHEVEATLPAEVQRMLRLARDRDATLEGRHVLVVEDDVRNVFALSSVLEPKGASVAIARNGREALEALAKSREAGATPIDLVLMDIMMPEMDGYTAMREIRRQPHWARLPIIALTAKAMRDDQEKCLAAGANDYIAKPLDVEKLLSLVRVWMPK